MALVSIHSFRTLPGKGAQHRARMDEARQLLQGQGLRAFVLDCIAGSHAGQLGMGIQYADNRAYTDAMQRLAADTGWQDFMAAAEAEGAAQLSEISLYTDVDPTYEPPADGTMTVVQLTQWRPIPGRFAGLMDSVATARGHLERLGGAVRVLQSMVGAEPMTIMVRVGFEDLDHYGDYSDKFATDEGFQTYWVGVMADPTATLVRSGLYTLTF